MSEWISVLAVYWALWTVDGARLAPRRLFTLRRGLGRTEIVYRRVSRPGGWPGSWRMTAADVPLALSPLGLSNAPVGAAGRPAEKLSEVRAWRWADVREVGVAGGWIFVNGARFCPDTGHVTAPRLLELAQLAASERERKIHASMRCWLRPAHLRRRARVLLRRTTWPARLNALSLVLFAALTFYVAADFAATLPELWSERLARALPPLLVGLLLLHVAAVVAAWRAVRRLRAVVAEKRRATLLSALLLPPQALRLRAVAAEGFFPPQHPLAAALAFGGATARADCAFNTLTDLRWPLGEQERLPLAREIEAWFRGALEMEIVALLNAAGISPKALLAAPAADVPTSCSYCPRCRDQFVAGPTECPHGIKLLPVRGS